MGQRHVMGGAREGEDGWGQDRGRVEQERDCMGEQGRGRGGGARRGNGSEVLAIVRKQNQCTVHSQYT